MVSADSRVSDGHPLQQKEPVIVSTEEVQNSALAKQRTSCYQ